MFAHLWGASVSGIDIAEELASVADKIYIR
jgi:hypothetical protein